MTKDDLLTTFKWIREQKKKFERTPVEEIDEKAYQLVQNIEFYAVKKNRELSEMEGI